MSTSPPINPNDPASPANAYAVAFDAAYYASKPPSFQGLYRGRPGSTDPNATTTPTQDELWAIGKAIIDAGGLVDEEIDLQAESPYTINRMRLQYGVDWVDAGTGQTVSSQVIIQGANSGPVPPGKIKVSILIEDYPPFPKPVVPVPPPPNFPKIAKPIGPLRIQRGGVGNLYARVVDSTGHDGYNIGDTVNSTSPDGLTGNFQLILGFMGMAVYWQFFGGAVPPPLPQ